MSSYLNELKNVLLTYDENKIKEFLNKHNKKIPEIKIVFWIAIHKAVCNLPNCTDEEKEFSRKWLKEHGFKEEIF